MEQLALEVGKSLFRKRFNQEPDLRIKDVTVPIDSIIEIDASNEILMLYDVSRNDQSFVIDSDTYQLSNANYFRNSVPTRPYDFSGHVTIDTTGATQEITFTFLVCYK